MYRDSTELTSPSEDKDAGLDLDLLSMEPKKNFLENSSRDSFFWLDEQTKFPFFFKQSYFRSRRQKYFGNVEKNNQNWRI